MLVSPKTPSLFGSGWFILISAESCGWLCSSNYGEVNVLRRFLDLLAACKINYIAGNPCLVPLPALP